MRRQERGAVLLLVLVIIALLATLVTEFAGSTLVDMRLTETFRDSTQAYYLAKGGVEAARMILVTDSNAYDALDEFWAQPVSNFPVGEGYVSISIEDLDGRLDLNRMVQVFDRASGRDNPNPVYIDRFRRLLELLGAPDPPGLTAALIDWLDLDENEQAGGGAESRYYLSLKTPYRAKNGPLDTVAELQMVRGFDADLVRQLEPHVTAGGAAKINLNTATAEVLACWDEEGVDLQIAEAIVDHRRLTPFESLEGLKDVTGYDIGWESSLKSQADLDVQSGTFRIRTEGFVGDGSRRVEAILEQAGGRYRLRRWKVN